jgi:serine/threonine protein kinase
MPRSIHRDIKPDNIFLDGDGNGDAVVGDFGLCLMDDGLRLTDTDEVVEESCELRRAAEQGEVAARIRWCRHRDLGRWRIMWSPLRFDREWSRRVD